MTKAQLLIAKALASLGDAESLLRDACWADPEYGDPQKTDIERGLARIDAACRAVADLMRGDD